MKNRIYTIRLGPEDEYYLNEIQKMRSETFTKELGPLVTEETWPDLIRLAILRMYNQTYEYKMYEDADLISKDTEKILTIR